MANPYRGALRSILFGSVAVLSINAAAAAQDNRISLAEQPMSDALRSVAQKTGESILFTPESVEGLRAPAISGDMSAQQAVSLLTRGTDLEVVSDGNNGLIVRHQARENSSVACLVLRTRRPNCYPQSRRQMP